MPKLTSPSKPWISLPAVVDSPLASKVLELLRFDLLLMLEKLLLITLVLMILFSLDNFIIIIFLFEN